MEIREQLSRWILSFYFYLDSGDWTQATMFSWKACLSTKPSFLPLANILVLPIKSSIQTWSFCLETIFTSHPFVAISYVMSKSFGRQDFYFFSHFSGLIGSLLPGNSLWRIRVPRIRPSKWKKRLRWVHLTPSLQVRNPVPTNQRLRERKKNRSRIQLFPFHLLFSTDVCRPT